ncbi:MFS transporter [Ramlibacter sp. G-1-2-2]|uniref:MFS transporter n=2 Tax=Ramlibacter agri TaxID=2728837 RepID=A0A848H143_9BURK|nr:MFS transporter [Ramlibacter agri]NML44187.1 MFS transporter [Ramlibacter agri]
MRSAILLLSIGAFFSGAGLRICDALIPRLARDFAITPGTAGRVVLTFAIAYGLSQLAFGPLGDRYGKARMVTVALFGCAIGAAACALAPGFNALTGLRMVWGLAAAGVMPLSMAWIGDAVPYEQRQGMLARLLMGTLTGMMAGQLAGGLFADSTLGWRGAFAMLAVGYGATAVLLLLRLRHIGMNAAPRSGSVGFVAQLSTVLREPWALRVLAAVFAEGVLLLGPMAYLPAYLHQRYGLTLSAASGLVALYAVGGLVYAMAARHIVQRWGERRMVLAGGIVMGLAWLALYLSPLFWLAGPAALFLGFGTYLYHNTLQTNATQMAPTARGTAVAMFAFCFFFGQAMGVSWAGWAFDQFGAAPLLLIPAVGLPLAGWWFAREMRKRGVS